MSTGSILCLKPGHTAPKDLGTRLLLNFKSSVSAAAIDKDKGLSKFFADDVDLASFLNETETKFKDRALILRLEDNEALQDEEKQPFDLVIDDEGKTVLLGVLEGDFEKYASDAATVSPETAFVQEFFADHCQKMFDDCGSDVKKFQALLEGAPFRKNLEEHMAPRGCIVLMGRDGSPLRYEVGNTKGVLSSWGFVTDACGYTEAKATPAKVDDSPKALTAAELKAMPYKERIVYIAAQKEGVKAAPDKQDQQPEEVVEEKVEEKTADKAVQQPEDNGVKIESDGVLPPTRMEEGRAATKFYERHWAKHTKDKVYKKPFMKIPAAEIRQNSYLWPHFNKEAIEKARANKNVEPTHVGKKDTTGTEVYVPVMSAKDTEDALAIARDKDLVLTTAEQLKSHVEKYKPFSTKLSIPLEEVLLWTEDRYAALNHKALTRLCDELRSNILALRPDILKGGGKKPNDVKAKVVDLKAMPYKERMAYIEAQKKTA